MAIKNMPQELQIDAAVQAYVGGGEEDEMARQRQKEARLTAAQRRKRAKDTARNKATYDLPEVLTQQIEALAAEHKVPKSQLVALFLEKGLALVLRGELNLELYKVPSRVPRFEFFLSTSPKMEYPTGWGKWG